MKKTLVALAALAATGAFAQAKLSGEFAYGYQTTTNNAGNAGGWGVDTSAFWLDASEDLGGGMSVATTLGLQNIQRKHADGIYALNGQMTLTTGIGAFYGGSIKSGDFVKSFSNVGGTWYSLDGAVTPARTQGDVFGFNTKLGAVGFGYQHSEPNGTAALGAGAEGNKSQRSNSYTVTYGAGALNVGAGVVQYDNQESDLATVGAAILAGNAANVYKDAARVGANYDLGAVKVGAAFQQANTTIGAKAVVTSFGLSAPMGALTLAANWQKVDVSDVPASFGAAATAANGSNSGYNLQATYNLSKQTYVVASYNNYTSRNYKSFAIDTSTTTQTNLILVKDF